MARHVVINLLLVCSLCVMFTDLSASLKIVKGIHAIENVVTNVVEDLIADLTMLDDDNNPVHIDLNLNYPETAAETKQNLHYTVFFYLYTKNNRDNPEKLFVDDVDVLKKSQFDPKRPTKFVTHGWINSFRSAACVEVRNALLEHDDYNVIVVDWSSISLKPYIWSSNRVVMIGQYVASMIDFLAEQGMDVSETTTIGHSLGAHVAGLAAYYAKGKVGYVVGLDPALPNFQLAGPGSRISHNDARYVEIIHTNGGQLGFKSPLGDSDFYPNGGNSQAGCLLAFHSACSHLRAFHFYAESINSKLGFHAVRCDSYANFERGKCDSNPVALMGGARPDATATGTYYLRTNKLPKYAQGKFTKSHSAEKHGNEL
ncbi:pancreatic triacylglycerol lipase-like [Colletes gigas]|uniref:pancreatic triacylglycerol lipase-like n=1 Tax=Colletes gigas TaxID=935657 RepID=UPI001C9A91F6|nr:pancreatic triacylglycerol lipase-like [Colletes gigas]